MADVTNTLSPQMTGVDVPLPGSATFHFTFDDSLHVVGGLASGATPLASGPRHCGQFSARTKGLDTIRPSVKQQEGSGFMGDWVRVI
jgi:hypothetical protein